LEQKIQDMIETISDFGMDAYGILQFSDVETLEQIHQAIEEYRIQQERASSNDCEVF